ncbi:ABC transporter substrate-binding protein [Gynuella sunshinyii]|uniref:ABC-type Fe3+-hydroxamate transport system, periplasmic component n=1 Tax=Gynuella sunshinyii YC6258 TaxID=1445510 RepID=A0A0C5VJ90_9GAMM|nr:iron-siderophore ABC transporter substrate-binding protein [Gynuella sunshinyii]AJQ94326.1 ABC-type Fe3+-hydroxamate transport system, periplasmic component [Gynuella sunshinyii YC6258]
MLNFRASVKRIMLFVAMAIAAFSARAEVTIHHAMGTTVLNDTPKRIVTLFQGATDATVALGITPVGVVDSWVEQPMYEYLREPLKGVPHVGLETQPNLEEIAKLKPDLIIAAKLRHEKIYPQLSQIAPTIALETVYKFKETLHMTGMATGRRQQAQTWLADWDARVARFSNAVSRNPDIQWPQKVALLNFRSDHARIYYNSFAGLILNELGFSRPPAHRENIWGVKLTSQESIPSMNADVFFIFMTETDPAVKQTYQQWTQHPLWKTLDAVKQQHVYEVNEVDWNMGGGPLAASRMLDSIFKHYQLSE